MSQIFFTRQDVDLIQTENPTSEFLISEVLLAIKESSYFESAEENVMGCNMNDFENSSKIVNNNLGHESKKMKRYVMHSPETKRKCIDLAKRTDLRTASDFFRVPLKSLKRWIKSGPERRKGGGRKIRDPEMERKLYDWYIDYHLIEKYPITSRMIKNKALELTSLLDFNASKGWLEKLKKKYNLEISRSLRLNEKM